MPTCNLGPCWTASPFNGTNFDTQSATTFNNLWIVGGQNSSNGNSDVQYSSDGTNWTRVSLSGTGGGGVKSFASGNGIIMGMVNFDKHILSSDGINWTVVAHWPPVSGEAGLTFGAGYFVFTFNSVDAVCYSTTGQAGTWSATYSAPFTFGYMNRSRVYGGGLFVTTGSAGFSYSPSPTTPVTPVAYPVVGVSADNIAYGSGAYIAITSNRSVYRSTDGINWTLLVDALPIAPDSLNDQWNTIIYSQGYFMCSKLDSIYLAISADGITWTLTSGDHTFDSTAGSGYSVLGTDGNGQYIAVKPLSSVSQVGVCPCAIPITGDYWIRNNNVRMQNVRLGKT